jgi:hypothetical protein
VFAAPIEAEARVPAPREQIYAHLSRLENHWGLAHPWIEVVSLETLPGDSEGGFQGGTVRMRGPLGLRRTARTRVLSAEPPARISGSARLVSGTTARVSWSFSEDGDGTRVRLAAHLESATALDRALLALGGRVWMRGRFGAALARLADELDPMQA